MRDPDAPEKRVTGTTINGSLIISMFLWARSAAFNALATDAHVRSIAAVLLEQADVKLFNDNLFVKEEYCDVVLPWHQDIPYYAVHGTDLISLWIAADPVTRRSGGVEYVAGSHLL